MSWIKAQSKLEKDSVDPTSNPNLDVAERERTFQVHVMDYIMYAPVSTTYDINYANFMLFVLKLPTLTLLNLQMGKW